MKNSAKSLCFIINYDYMTIGGAMTRFRQEVEYFSFKGYPVSVVYSSVDPEKSFRKGKVEYYNIHHIPHSVVSFLMQLFFVCLKHYLTNPRITFIAHNPISSIPPALLRFMGLHPRTLLVMHGPSAVEIYLKGKRAKATLQLIIDRIAFALAGKIVAVSEYEQNYAIRIKANPRKVFIIRNGIKILSLTDSVSFRREMGIPRDFTAIGYIGSIATYRGVEFLLEAFSIVKSMTTVPLVLVLVFREELFEREIKAIKEMTRPYQEDVYISKPRKDISPVLSTLGIYASHFSKKVDGIGFSVMEAMSVGLPVITGKDGITNRLLESGVDAILVEKENPKHIAEAIKTLAENSSLRRQIGANAKKTALDRFSDSRMLALCEKEYLSVVPR